MFSQKARACVVWLQNVQQTKDLSISHLRFSDPMQRAQGIWRLFAFFE